MKKRSKATDMHSLWMKKILREYNKAVYFDNDDASSLYMKLLNWGKQMAKRTAKKKGGLGRR